MYLTLEVDFVISGDFRYYTAWFKASYSFLLCFEIGILGWLPMSTTWTCVWTTIAGILIGGPAQLISTSIAADLGDVTEGNFLQI